jgi:hypothetical protein
MQAAIGATYVFLNGAYWLVALFPLTWFWNISKETTPKHLKFMHKRGADGIQPNLTRTMWCAIQCTKDIVWIDTSGAIPRTPAWVEWAQLAYDNKSNPNWNAIGERDRVMKKLKHSGRRSTDLCSLAMHLLLQIKLLSLCPSVWKLGSQFSSSFHAHGSQGDVFAGRRLYQLSLLLRLGLPVSFPS